MAENAAHITSSLQAKPSIFEVIAQDSLGELLYPSFKIIVQVNYHIFFQRSIFWIKNCDMTFYC